ncbi:type I DNA topoisomerase [Bartonella sp. HY038]|uniref:type I DNA topoisomerase n=1 Tax=Bartonella sp. HY038 TaxID=2759660 RepID=UPI0015FD2662|nr:type I DNA topoisomerase [Bartonella sp. HY038]
MKVVVVESPAKAKTINKYLGSDYKVFASFGHVRDLPAKDGSVLPDEDFAMKWDTDSASAKRLSEIAKAVKDADQLILATDPDREGEAISWHVLDVLNAKRVLKDKPVSRVVFNAITKSSVLDAMAHPRQIDDALVNAYLARRALDYLFGFNLSPVLWRKLPGARSAGRVQSVALRLICDREAEIERFIREEYWTIAAELNTPRQEKFIARLTDFEGKKLGKLDIKNGEQAEKIRKMLVGASFKIETVEAKPTKRNPGPPFTTSTLQQAASSRLSFSASRTMQVAQRLYEGVDLGGETTGLITYMRTDGVQMAPEGIDGARKSIAKTFGNNYVPEKPRFYSAKAKNAQEAHEAIRPTDFSRTPQSMKAFLDADQYRLYDLIWKRAIASQMLPADIERTTVDIAARNGESIADLRATGSVIRFDGFLAAYMDVREEDSGDDEGSARLPFMEKNEVLTQSRIDADQHSTEPPPRYSEASLIKKLEELGIGRPSTYASTLATLQDRDYINIDKRKLIPEAKGRVVTAFLENFFNRYVEYDFTASLEDKLDLISDGKLVWKDVLRDFWQQFSSSIADIADLRVTAVLDVLNEVLAPIAFPAREDGSDPRSCPLCKQGQLSLKLGRYGAFVGCSNYPECKFTRQLGSEGEGDGKALGDEPAVLGQDPETGEDITLRTGRFGPYVQRGDGKDAKRAGLPKGWQMADIDFEKAQALLALPRDIGLHPETGTMITASIGRYGPYIANDGKYANLENADEVFSIGINRAVSVLADKANKSGGRASAASAKPIANLGAHPDGGEITVRDGRYGPYVNWGKINATITKGMDPASLTLEEAITLLAAKAAKMPTKKAAAKKAPAKKAATKKTAAKKAVTKKVAGENSDEKPKAAKKAAPKKAAVTKKTAAPKKASVKKAE